MNLRRGILKAALYGVIGISIPIVPAVAYEFIHSIIYEELPFDLGFLLFMASIPAFVMGVLFSTAAFSSFTLEKGPDFVRSLRMISISTFMIALIGFPRISKGLNPHGLWQGCAVIASAALLSSIAVVLLHGSVQEKASQPPSAPDHVPSSPETPT